MDGEIVRLIYSTLSRAAGSTAMDLICQMNFIVKLFKNQSRTETTLATNLLTFK